MKINVSLTQTRELDQVVRFSLTLCFVVKHRLNLFEIQLQHFISVQVNDLSSEETIDWGKHIEMVGVFNWEELHKFVLRRPLQFIERIKISVERLRVQTSEP